MSYSTVTYGGAKLHVFDTKGMNKCIARLSSSSKVAALSTLRYTELPTDKWKEVARVNAAIFDLSTGTHQGWEYSDVFKTSCSSDTRADVMQFKDGTYLFDDISADSVDLSTIEWAYSGSHIILQNGNDVVITASWREQYPKGSYCWSWFATRNDGTIVVGAVDSANTISTDDLRTYLKSLGCTNAMVNDGGGSAELIVSGKVVNRTTERKIANGLFIYESLEEDTNTDTGSSDESSNEDAETIRELTEQVNTLTEKCTKLENIISEIKKLVA